jgi:hypothetical protein
MIDPWCRTPDSKSQKGDGMIKGALQLGFYVIGVLAASSGAKAQWGDPVAIFVIGLLLCAAVLVERIRGPFGR